MRQAHRKVVSCCCCHCGDLRDISVGDLPVVVGPIGKINIPAAGLDAKPAPGTFNTCKTQPKKNSNSPLCIDFDCLSQDEEFCAVEPHIYCPCLLVTPDPEPHSANASALYYAQSLIVDFIELTKFSINLTSTGCITVTTVYSANQSSIDTGSRSFYECGGGTIAGLIKAISGSSTTSYCAEFQSLPAGFTHSHPVITGTSAVSTAPATPSPTPVTTPSPSPTPRPPPATTTPSPPPFSQPGPQGTCGAPFCF